MKVKIWMGMLASVLVLGSVHEFSVEGCNAHPIPAEYRRPRPDVIYHYVARKDHAEASVKGKALPGEVCNYDHRILGTVPDIEYDKFHAECVKEADVAVSSTCEYVYDRRGYPIDLNKTEIKVNNHPEDRWNKFNKTGDTFISTLIYYKKCICPYMTTDKRLVYHNTWDDKLSPPRPSCTATAPDKTKKDDPGKRGYTCLRTIKKEDNGLPEVKQEMKRIASQK